MVLVGEIRHWLRIRFALTRPYFGTARIMSKTLAESTHSGGSSTGLDLDLARLQVPLELGPLACGSRWPLEGPHALVGLRLGTDVAARSRRGHRRGDHIHGSEAQAPGGIFGEFISTSSRGRGCDRRLKSA